MPFQPGRHFCFGSTTSWIINIQPDALNVQHEVNHSLSGFMLPVVFAHMPSYE